MKKIKYNNEYIYIDDTPVDKKKTGVLIQEEDTFDDTMKVDIVNTDNTNEDTLTDIFGDKNE